MSGQTLNDPVVEIDEVTKTFDNLVEVHFSSLRMDQGQTLYLIGPNEAGKTTLPGIISTLARPDSVRLYPSVFLRCRSRIPGISSIIASLPAKTSISVFRSFVIFTSCFSECRPERLTQFGHWLCAFAWRHVEPVAVVQ
jgi:ABC-type polar amino acid transport system ATPase subunit